MNDLQIRYLGEPVGSGLLVVGRVVKPQGIRGEIKIIPASGHPEDFAAYRRLMLLAEAAAEAAIAGPWQAVVGSRTAGGAVLVTLAGVESRDQAEALRDRRVAVAVGELPAPVAGELYWHELKGLAALDEQGREVGTVGALLATPARPTLVINARSGREILVPVHHEFMTYRPAAAAQAAHLLLTPPEGLLELN